MASDLISREALVDKSEILYQHTTSGKIIPWSAVRVCAINNAPAVDAVEVVRCKECKHFDDGECAMMSEPKERREYEWWAVIVAEDDFCSSGERRE